MDCPGRGQARISGCRLSSRESCSRWRGRRAAGQGCPPSCEVRRACWPTPRPQPSSASPAGGSGSPSRTTSPRSPPLGAEQLTVLREGSDEPIHVDASNAYFLLDVLWALGLANKNTVLTEGPMAQQGWEQAGGYANTDGWTKSAKAGPQAPAAPGPLRPQPY